MFFILTLHGTNPGNSKTHKESQCICSFNIQALITLYNTPWASSDQITQKCTSVILATDKTNEDPGSSRGMKINSQRVAW